MNQTVYPLPDWLAAGAVRWNENAGPTRIPGGPVNYVRREDGQPVRCQTVADVLVAIAFDPVYLTFEEPA
ncbi:MAG: hypothetical protein KY454_09325 [Actinobacteria bacterium]|nr:hypothetical protein [Actinomycetota bacterium]